MLRFKTYPPQSANDVEFTQAFTEEMKLLGDKGREANARFIGNAVGSCILANLTRPNVGLTLMIASELCETSELFNSWDIREQFLEGAVEGTINENSHFLPKERPQC